MEFNTHATVYSRDVVFEEDGFPSLANLTSTSDSAQETQTQHPAAASAPVPAPTPEPATISTAEVPIQHTLPQLRKALGQNVIRYSFRTETRPDPPSSPAPKRHRLTHDTDVTFNSEEDLQEQEHIKQLLHALLAILYVLEPTT
ncbi:hypothetical protein PC129_g19467 [Phytophthora cactorum]|uniref:Uncharacterized protein n=1 Tax=Phytophthora cactorum TaxID=29920 RepID=A0A8T1HBT3_9STRA|nr:hypothetical protein Pcac1_g14025 [Phytophthora cactorum]KAG2799230.1 hypothetical protein PC112_g20999 [Phytophthora cactorum]KAG2807073.1 hypothetical protein PC111_g17083 [Phytophthora cactorum]KAG2831487.1 hypothetical protein PC113_g20921 [Phytophthora cactorum]KAG2894285.1 hypothetical protein PC115_g18194 [Phytophthora cactorum]